MLGFSTEGGMLGSVLEGYVGSLLGGHVGVLMKRVCWVSSGGPCWLSTVVGGGYCWGPYWGSWLTCLGLLQHQLSPDNQFAHRACNCLVLNRFFCLVCTLPLVSLL